MTSIRNVSRRTFFKAGGGLALSFAIPLSFAQSRAAAAAPFAPNAFLRITSDSSVTVIVKHVEMGQGTYTGLPTLVAEELDADWSQVRVEGAPADARRYNNTFWGPAQGTGGSTSLANSWEQLRQAGAAARAMLVAAAAARWGVPAGEVAVARGVVSHASGRSARFGELADDAARQPVPTELRLKSSADFRLIGKPLARTDSAAKSTGAATYTLDVQLPGMLTALVIHPPRFGARLERFDASRAKAIPGVVDVVAFRTPVRNGVAVLADGFWAAKKARDAVDVEWDEAGAFRIDSAEVMRRFRALIRRPGTFARVEGDIEKTFSGAARIVQAEYEFPFLAHAAMEPMNCVVRIDERGCEIWNGAQFQTPDQLALAAFLGIRQEQVRINQLFAGGSFGRRANPHSDYVLEAAAIAQASGTDRPIKLIWTREDDMKAGYYRPAYLHAVRGALDAAGNLIGWQHRIVGQSISAGTPFEATMIKGGIDASSVEGASTLPYEIPNLRVELTSPKFNVPVQWWRSVGSSHTAFATECFLDEVARAAGRDPLQLRLSLLSSARHKAVLERAAQMLRWGSPSPAGTSRGIAVHESFGTVVAQAVQLSRRGDAFHLDRVTCAVDCGIAVNPSIVEAQMHSGIGFGLSAALAGEITLADGRIEQSNFHDYPIVRIDQMPAVEVSILPSDEAPTGVGEPATPVIGPALANALLAATGQPARRLPLNRSGFRLA